MSEPFIIIVIILGYLGLLLMLGMASNKFFRGSSKDYFVASHSIGPVLLLMSVFGTTMTAFALVGSTGKAFERGIGTYGLMASISGLIHAAIFFLIGIRLWVYGKKYGYVTQIQYFRARFDSNGLGYLLFPILVGLVVPYLLIGVIGAGKTLLPVTAGAFPDLFTYAKTPQWNGGIPPWLSGLVICGVVLMYVFAGGSRGAAWANTFQTIVFMGMGLVAFIFISNALGGLQNANDVAAKITPEGKVIQEYKIDRETHSVVKLKEPKVIGTVEHPPKETVSPHMTRTEYKATLNHEHPKTGKVLGTLEREFGTPPWMFATYLFIPLSVGMFPHLFQHWLTAKSAKTFRLTVVAHPIFIMVVWVPCVLIGAWATGLMPAGLPPAAILSNMVNRLVESPVLTGFLIAGVLAAIMSSLDSQFLCLGTMFTNDVVIHAVGQDRFTDKQIVWIARGFIIAIVALTYALSIILANANVFDLAVWCFSGFGALFPIVFAAVYWQRTSKWGVYASIIATMATWLYFFHQSGWGGEYTVLNGVMPVTFCFFAGVIALIGVSLITPAPRQEVLDKFFPKGKPIGEAALEAEEKAEANVA